MKKKVDIFNKNINKNIVKKHSSKKNENLKNL